MAGWLKQNLRLVNAALRHKACLHENSALFQDWREPVAASSRSMANDAQRKTVSGSLSDSLRDSLRNVWRDRDKRLRQKTPDHDADITSLENIVPQIVRKLDFAERVRKDRSIDAITEHLRTFGYTFRVRKSGVSGAGRGVFLAMGGFERGEVLFMYPGTVYTISRLLEIAALESVSDGIMDLPSGPRLPMFLYKNRYLLQERAVHAANGEQQRVDLMLDGNPFGQSALRFLKEAETQVCSSDAQNNNTATITITTTATTSLPLTAEQAADSSWLELKTENPPRDKKYRTDLLLNDKGVGRSRAAQQNQPLQFNMLGNRSFLALGHLLNHCPAGREPHLRFVFVPLADTDAPPALLAHLPNVNARPDRAERWAIAAVAVRAADREVVDPDQPEELFSNYGRDPNNLGWKVDDRR